MTELHEWSALEQVELLRAGEVSSSELTRHYLDRIERYGDRLGAFVTVTPELALAQAAAADTGLRRSRAAGSGSGTAAAPGVLVGVPVALKDLIWVAGVRCTLGSAAFADFVPDADDGVVTRLRSAGCVLLGKTSTAEFGLSCYTETALGPPARTPYDLSRSAGGSSGGSGAAVAGGLAAVGVGTDGGGSVRIPASACGLVGLKPSRGRVSPGPLRVDVSGLPTSGPLAATVADAAAVLDVIAGSLPGDPYLLPSRPPGETFLASTSRPPGRLRIGCWREPVLAEVPVHPEVVAAHEAAVSLLAALGHDVVEIARPFGPEVAASFEAAWSVLAAVVPVDPAAEHLLLPLTRHLRAAGRSVSGPEYAAAVAAMQQAARSAAEATSSYDVLLSPTLAAPPAPVGAIRDDADPAGDFAAQKAFSPFCATYNVTGQPAISLPLGWTRDGLPLGMLFAARLGEEALLLSLAAQVEAAVPPRRRPADPETGGPA